MNHELFPFWDGLTEEQKTLLENNTQERVYGAGETVHDNRVDCVGLFVVLQGHLRVYTLSEEGRELTLYRLFERDMCLLSASCIIRGLHFDVMVEAGEETRVLHIPAALYQRLMDTSVAVARYTNELMASHFSEVMWLMDQVMNRKMDARIAALLVEESQLRQTDDLTVTHEQLANHLGTAREVVTRMLKHMQQEGLVRLHRGHVVLVERTKICRMAEGSLR